MQDKDMVKETEDKEKQAVQNEIKEYPLLILRGRVLMPDTFMTCDVGREKSVAAVEAATSFGGTIVVASQKNAVVDEPIAADVLDFGVIAVIRQMTKMPNGNVKLSLQSKERVKITSFTKSHPYFSVEVIREPYTSLEDGKVEEAYLRVAKEAFFNYSLNDKRITKEIVSSVTRITSPNAFIDNALTVVMLKENDIQDIFCTTDTTERLIKFAKVFASEADIAKIEKKIADKVKQNVDKGQKEYYLREQLRAIHDELGEGEEEDNLEKAIKEKHLPEEVEKKALKELERMSKINPSSPDYSVLLNYLDWILDLPFETYTEDRLDLTEAKKILDEDHFGLTKLKQRIIEYIAVLKLTGKIQGSILCLVGPPGVGKTSVATSVARALGRKFVRMSLGGLKDEAEIRGHRKTYVGAMPGRIIYGLKTAGSSNPVFLLDEIDKLSSDIHGDPASALLEVLDPAQNATFRDRYLEIPYDLSKVLFITTANSLDTIPYPLLDRMEVLELSGYTDREKSEIAKRYLIPKQLKFNGLTPKQVTFTDKAVREIIEGYTMEAGVRNLEREIGSVIRKVAIDFASDINAPKRKVTEKDVNDLLGVKKRITEKGIEKDEIGAVNGLAWTSVGGTVLTVEVGLMKGKGEIILTGKLGDVMKESARAAISYLKSSADKYGIDVSLFENTDIHIHVPEGATPKDGPSAGITMATAVLSALIKKPVKKSVAMTGEITLRGKVLPIGGLKEKAMAAERQGIKTVIIPKDNIKDVEEIPEEVRKRIDFRTVEEVSEAFDIAINFKTK